MTQYDSYPYYEESSFQCVRLDYKTSLSPRAALESE